MPVHNDYKRTKTSEESTSATDLEEVIKAYEKSYDKLIVKIYEKARKCRGIIPGRGGICGHHYIPETCKIHPSDQYCRITLNKIGFAKMKLVDFENKIAANIDADSRFLYWIDETSRERRLNKQVNGYLTNAELDVFRKEIYCQYDVDKIVTISLRSITGPSKNREIKSKTIFGDKIIECPNISERLLNGESLIFYLRFNEAYKKNRDAIAIKLFTEILASKINIRGKLKLDYVIDKLGSGENYTNDPSPLSGELDYDQIFIDFINAKNAADVSININKLEKEAENLPEVKILDLEINNMGSNLTYQQDQLELFNTLINNSESISDISIQDDAMLRMDISPLAVEE